MAAPTIYRSDDASAPVIDGSTASALRLALNAILVDGYGSKPAAGWAKAYEDAGNNLVVYQNAGLGRFLRINDPVNQFASARGYRSMSDVNTGTEPFPAASLNPAYLRKSITANSTARPWICFANERHFYLIVFGNQTTLGSSDGGDAHIAFGELESVVPGDEFTTFIHGVSETTAGSSSATAARQAFNFNGSTGAQPTTYCEGHYSQIVAPTSQILPVASTPFGDGISGGTAFPAYPDPATGKLLISRKMARMPHGATNFLINRGYFPGLWTLCHPASGLTTFDTFSGSGSLSGRAFMIVRTGAGGVVFETTADSW